MAPPPPVTVLWEKVESTAVKVAPLNNSIPPPLLPEFAVMTTFVIETLPSCVKIAPPPKKLSEPLEIVIPLSETSDVGVTVVWKKSVKIRNVSFPLTVNKFAPGPVIVKESGLL